MTRFLGVDAISISLAASLFGIIAAVLGVRRNSERLVQASFAAMYTTFGLLTVATVAMVYALVTHDFSISYVAQVGSRATPTFYTVISLWGALEGSILFWAWVLALYGAAVVWLNRRHPGPLIAYTAATMMAVSIFFGILLRGPANPFREVFPVPLDGPGPNPLLQNHPLMAVHPPLLYLGYVGLTVPFAFAVGAALSNQLGTSEWLRLSRRWTMVSWMFLTAAIIAGMWWSYEVLGWGGYWAWDPVENASFMPWLTATAFLHSAILQERRAMLKLWNLNLVVATFVLTILGTFLTRSGVLSSVHAFTTGTIGYYFLAFIAVVVLFAFALVAGNSEQLRTRGNLDAVLSRDTVFLLNNLFLTAFTFTVLLGTLYPLIAEAVRGVKVSVGAPFFNKMTLPLCASLLFLMGVGPALPWRRATADQAKRKLLPPTAAALFVAVVSVVLGTRQPYAVATFAFGAFALTANLQEYALAVRARRRSYPENYFVAFAQLVRGNQRRYGGYLAHIGVVITAIAIAASSAFRTEYDATIRPGQVMNAGNFGIRLEQLWARDEPHRTVVGASLSVLRDGRPVGEMQPRTNFYAQSEEPVPTPAVRSRPSGDLYINLMAFAEDGSTATLRVIIEPLVPWIWFGGGVICMGAIVSLMPGARRRREVEVESLEAVAGHAA
ncbi:MAG TPA: heme lyase CcmF/NrfE family subunit [Gemmatimonadaceae bacterium]|nr:heme lyase CcmF/NrfE family subunit [Gemmatimonadaceae bacterium]